MTDGKFDQGMKMRRRVLGNRYVDQAEGKKTDFDSDFQQFITETAWGNVWLRPNLDIKARHMLTIAMLAALGKEHELAVHIRGTANTGISQEELREIFIHVAIYAGVPAANAAFATAKKVFSKEPEIFNLKENTI